MAIGLGQYKRAGAQMLASEKIAKAYKKQQKKAKKRGFFSKLLGGVGGKLLGGAITGFLGLTGIGAPIGLALGNMLAKKGAHELTRGMAADPSKIKAGGKYGYGEEEAKTLREGLLEQQKSLDPWKTRGGFGKELLSSTISHGMSGGFKGTLKDFGKGSFIKEGEGLLGGGGWEGALKGGKAGLGEAFTWGGEEPAEDVATDVTDDVAESDLLTDEQLPRTSYDEFGNPFSYQQGGQVPQQQQLMQLLALAQMQQQQTAYDGTPLEEEGKENSNATIADYFGMQGKSLGGSNKQSLAELLGRK